MDIKKTLLQEKGIHWLLWKVLRTFLTHSLTVVYMQIDILHLIQYDIVFPEYIELQPLAASWIVRNSIEPDRNIPSNIARHGNKLYTNYQSDYNLNGIK